MCMRLRRKAAVKKNEQKDLDYIVLLITIILLGIGLVMVFSASAASSNEPPREDMYYYLRRQGFWSVLGLISMFIMSKFNYWKIKKLVLPLMIVNICLLAAVYIPGVGIVINGARRWIIISGFQLQPSEVSKIAVLFFTAWFLAKRQHNMHNFFKTSFIPLVIMGISFVFILVQPDLGTALVIAACTFIMLVVAGMPFLQVTFFGLLGSSVAFYLMTSEPYRKKRLLAFINPWEDPLDTGYHIIQSLLALGPGGLLGMGLGRSRQKLWFLPEPQNDFIFAIIGEELGFIGTSTILILFFILLWRGFKIAMQAPDAFGSLLAAGITTMIGLQVIINIGVVTGSLPVTGINLPLISAGGSSLFITLTAIGILLNISKHVKI